MHDVYAYISRHHLAADHAAERLRTSGVGTFFRPRQLSEAGLTPDQLPSLVRRRVVEQVSRGLYHIVGAEPTENSSLAMTCARVPNSIVCLLSALRVHNIGSHASSQVWLGIPHKAHRPCLPRPKVRVVRFSGAAWVYGVKRVEFEGVPARITSPARTIADCFRLERLVGLEVALEALRDALGRQLVSLAELVRAEEVLPSRRLHAQLDMSSI